MLDAEQLYLVDDDGLYYGSNGLISRLPQYDSIREALQTEVATLRQGECMLVVLEIRPFTVDGSTFRWALAEFDPAAYQDELTLDGLNEINRSQTEFINSISFHIRTPLTGIVGFTALAKRHIQEPQTLGEYLERVGEASAQLLSKLNEGLDATGWHRYVEEENLLSRQDRPIDVRGMRILLVEDNALNRDIGVAILSEMGMVVECAENGQVGFRKVATAKPGCYDLVLMDIQMPVMDGYETTTMIRRLRNKMLAEIPILAMTANVSVEDKRKAFDAGMDGYVEKPMNMEKLLDAIQKVLRKPAAPM